MGHGFWGNLHRLAWSARAIYLLLFLIVVFSWNATRLPLVNASWRVYYYVCAVFSTLYLIYAILLITDVISVRDYRQLAGWVAALLFTCLLWPAILHRTEWSVIKHYKEDSTNGGD